MGVSIFEMRKFVSRAYFGDNWKRKVKKMSDEQVYAIYNKLLEQRKKEQKIKENHKPNFVLDKKMCIPKTNEFESLDGTQLTFKGF